LSHGDTRAAPSTVRGTMLLDEFGQRRIKSKLDDIENGLNILGRVLIEMIQGYYTFEKVFTIVNPQTNKRETVRINYPVYDEFTGEEIGRAMDVTRGSYDIIVISGSTLPTNRWAKLESRLELYDRGIITPDIVLEATDIPNREELVMKLDLIKQYEQVIAQMQEEIKKLKGDLQTAERETMHARQRTELSKFQAKLKEQEARVKAIRELAEKRLYDTVDNVKEKFKIKLSEKKGE